jgi:hypothetical protein
VTVAKRGEVRPYRVAYRWPGGIGDTGTESTSERALDRARRQALQVSGSTGERDCLVRITRRDRPSDLPIYLRACPSCEGLTAWASGGWRHTPEGGLLCSGGTRPERFREDPVGLWSA